MKWIVDYSTFIVSSKMAFWGSLVKSKILNTALLYFHMKIDLQRLIRIKPPIKNAKRLSTKVIQVPLRHKKVKFKQSSFVLTRQFCIAKCWWIFIKPSAYLVSLCIFFFRCRKFKCLELNGVSSDKKCFDPAFKLNLRILNMAIRLELMNWSAWFTI